MGALSSSSTVTGAGRLRCRALWKRYGGTVALRGVSLDMPETGVVALVGPNGSGKTTLFQVMTGFEAADAGDVWLGEQSLLGRAPWEIAALGVVRTFQEVRLAGRLSAIENVMACWPMQRGEGVVASLTRLGLQRAERDNAVWSREKLERVGLGAQAMILAGKLSYGQRRLLTVACCLATRARILLLDEPFAGVDEAFSETLLFTLRQAADEGHLVVLVEHDLRIVRTIAERVYVLEAGTILAEGPADEVLTSSLVRSAFDA